MAGTGRWCSSVASRSAAPSYQQGLIGGFLHLYIGQEATGVGAVAALGPDDHVITAYRDHGIALARHYPSGRWPRCGKRTGVSGGKGGSMHLADRELPWGHGIVGGHLPLAAGIALKIYMERTASCWP